MRIFCEKELSLRQDELWWIVCLVFFNNQKGTIFTTFNEYTIYSSTKQVKLLFNYLILISCNIVNNMAVEKLKNGALLLLINIIKRGQIKI